MVVWLRRVLGVSSFAVLAIGAPLRSEAAELRVDFSELASLASSFLAQAHVRLHNAQSGVLDFSAGSSITIAGAERPIPLPVRSFDALGSKFAYLINDLNSTSIKVEAVKGAVRLSIAFESDGPELVARCLSGLCPSDAALPDIEWQKAAVTIDLVPVKGPSGLSLKAERAEISGDVTPRCRTSAGFLTRSICEAALPKVRQTILRYRKDLSAGLVQQLASSPVQDSIATALQSHLKFGSAGEVRVSRVAVESGGKAVVVSFCLAC